MSDFNPIRKASFDALCETLDDLVGKTGVSERSFHAHWQSRLAAKPDLIADGWYTPPPNGMAVLFGDRVTYDSLRNPQFWPGDTLIDWRNDLLFAYCSPVGRGSGMLGDTSVTLYFGRSPEIRAHFRKTYKATQEILDGIEAGKYEGASALVSAANKLFSQAGLTTNAVSVTDPTPANMGHSYPVISLPSGQDRLTAQHIDAIRTGRQFLNLTSEWQFDEGTHFTFEPQLISTTNPDLPKVTYYYLATRAGAEFQVCRDIDSLLERYGVI